MRRFDVANRMKTLKSLMNRTNMFSTKQKTQSLNNEEEK